MGEPKEITEDTWYEGMSIGTLLLTKCKCGQEWKPGWFILKTDPSHPAICPKCGRKMYFEMRVHVYEIVEGEKVKGVKG